MKTYTTKWEHTVIQRHYIIILIKFIKMFMFFIFALILYILFIKYHELIDSYKWLNIAFFVIIFSLLNYCFFKFIFYLIIYLNNIIVLYKDQFVIIKSSLLMKDDIENIDIYKIIKVDSYSRWFFSNVLWYWSFIIEQQKNDVRTFDYISNPHKLLKMFEQQREIYKTKKYVKV